MAALTLWLTDRSRYETGTGHCARHRFLGSHAGPTGYGWSRKAQSVPLVTGGMLANVQELIHRWVLANHPAEGAQQAPPDSLIWDWIQDAKKSYLATVEKRGLSNIIDAADLATRTNEQLTLLESLTWLWVDIGLPELLDEWRIVWVEEEAVSVLGCTCGLGDRMGTPEDHDSRECQGIGYQTKGDLICQALTDARRYSYHEFKAPGETNMHTDAAWKYRVQLISGVLGAEDRLGVVIDEVYLHQHLKGKRQAPDYNPETKKYEGPKFQNSPLVYGWYRAGDPPLLDESWEDAYFYKDNAGKNRKRTDHERRGLWEYQPPEAAGMPPLLYWGRGMDEAKRRDQYRRLGPFMRTEAKLARFVRRLVGEEKRWQAVSWELHDSGKVWGDPEYMAILDALVPQARGQQCHSYYGEPCEMLGLCDELDGWQTPEVLGYIPRRPHHLPELAQAIERGLLPPDDGLAEEAEE